MSKRFCSVFGLMVTLGICVGWATSAVALPAGRHYEMVSPPYKGGYGINTLQGAAVEGADEGDAVAFDSLGVFSGAPSAPAGNGYLARRSPASGWVTTPLMPPASIAQFAGEAAPLDFAPTLAASTSYVVTGPNAGAAEGDGVVGEFLLHPSDMPDTAPDAPLPAPNFEVLGQPLEPASKGAIGPMLYEGASADFCHVLFRHESLLAEAQRSVLPQLYDLESDCRGRPASLRLPGVDNKAGTPELIDPSCESELGTGTILDQDVSNAIAADGEEIFFTDHYLAEAKCPEQVFVRLSGERTLEVSRPLDALQAFGGCAGEVNSVPGEVPCAGASTRAPAEFRGASRDGSKVFFTTTAQLTAADDDEGPDLYMATIGCPHSEAGCPLAKREVTSLHLVSSDPDQSGAGEKAAAEVQGVVAVSSDGSHAYFVARGDLLGESARAALTAEGRALPVPGADNLYVYDATTETTAFVADLCSGVERSGEAADASCPTSSGNDQNLWLSDAQEAQTTADGRYLVFASYGQLTGDDTDNAKDIYRYDASTDTLARVSLGEAGYDANGNRGDIGGAAGATETAGDAKISISGKGSASLSHQYELGSRAVSEDGSRVVFETVEPLSPAAVNGLSNLYEWHEGVVSLVSGGSATAPVEQAVITPSGRDVFFITTQSLLAQDTDNANDVYDARVGSGFPAVPGSRETCSGDACQGPLSAPAPALVAGGTATQVPGENLPAPAKKAKPKQKKPRSQNNKRCERRAKRRCKRGARRASRHAKRRGGAVGSRERVRAGH